MNHEFTVVDSGSKIGISILSFFTVLLFFIGFLFTKYSANTKKQCSYETTAVVSEIIEDNDGDGTMFTPVFTYTYDGKEHTIKSRISSSSLKLREGETTRFFIDPGNPSKYYCPGESSVMILAFGFFGFGAVFLIATVVAIVIHRMGGISVDLSETPGWGNDQNDNTGSNDGEQS